MPRALARRCGIRAKYASRLAGYKVPRGVSLVTEFPTTANGKIQKFRLRELATQHRAQE